MANVALFGSIWLLAFPISVLIADMLPARLRHRVVSIGSVGLQIVALQYLVYLCFFSKSFMGSCFAAFSISSLMISGVAYVPTVADPFFGGTVP